MHSMHSQLKSIVDSFNSIAMRSGATLTLHVLPGRRLSLRFEQTDGGTTGRISSFGVLRVAYSLASKLSHRNSVAHLHKMSGFTAGNCSKQVAGATLEFTLECLSIS